MFKLRKSKRDARRTVYFDTTFERASILKELKKICSEDLIKDSRFLANESLRAVSFKNKYRPMMSWSIMKCNLTVVLVRGGNLLKHEAK